MTSSPSTSAPRYSLNLTLAAGIFLLLGLALVLTANYSHSGIGGFIVGPPLLAVGFLLTGLVVLRARPKVSRPARTAGYLLLVAAIAFFVFLALVVTAPSLFSRSA